jgi:hypothetical protein
MIKCVCGRRFVLVSCGRGKPKIGNAPDVMVALGRQGDRGSYQQWNEDNIACATG